MKSWAFSRRDFLRTGAALGLAPWLPAKAQPSETRVLRAGLATQALVGVGNPPTAVWAYGGTVPGPELRFRQGERLRIEVENALGTETTVHWHGIRLPNAMDGVPHLTQKPIAAGGGRFLYEFDLPDAGTYWYHPHLGSPEQVGRGLYGALIVEEREPPKVDRDVVWVLSDWRLDREARIVADFMSFMDASHAGRIGNTVTVNGAIRESFGVRAGERIRLRLINASNARIYGLRFEGHAPQLIAFDGQPLAPRRIDRVVIGPAQRADLLIDCGAAPGSRHRVVDNFYERRAYRLIDLAYSTEDPLRTEFPPVPRLAANTVPQPDLASAERLRIVFGGGMMGNMPGGMMGGNAGRMIWTVNGKAVAEHDHSHEPLLKLARGRSYVFELVNDTAWHHPIHLHGHVFNVISGEQKGTSGDTVLIDPRSRAEIAFMADNPGYWMLHCHVLEHQASGMSMRRVLTIFGVAVALNYAWELAQTPFYEGVTLPGALWHCFTASVGDGVLVLVILAAVSAAMRTADWYVHPTPRSYLTMVLAGLAVAIVVEWWGLHVAERWQYSTLMPIIPVAEIGVVPVLQMLLLPPLIFSFAKRLTR